MPAKLKPIDIKLSEGGGFDARSSADEVDLGAWRYVLNFRAPDKKKRCRVPGWDKLATQSDYNNQDLHDQLLSLTGFPSRLPVTFLFEAISTRKTTKLIAGTRNALYALNVGTGNWKILSDRMGGTDTRWKAAQLNDTVLFTNNFNELVYWQFDQGVTEANDQSVALIPDLVTIGITKVAVVIEWQGHIFIFNIVQDGAVRSGAALWCNYQKPLDWVPNAGSTAGSSDVMTGETVLNALPLSNRLLVFTNKGIWEVQAVGGEAVFAFTKRYDPKQGESCLFYPNTLVSKGDELVYAGVDGIYTFSFYNVKPQRAEWIHRASSVMFDYINREDCDVHVAAYNSERKELLFSYAKNDESIPSETLVLNTELPWAYVIDHGFAAMAEYTLKSQSQLVRDFLIQNCICDEDGLNSYWSQFTKEGGFCTTQEAVTCDIEPQSIWTSDTETITYLGETIEVEDYDKATADADSLCAVLGNTTLSQLCEAEARQDECSAGLRFTVASSEDYCIKEFSDNYYREKCVGFTGCGSYERRGYRTLLRSGPISAGNTDADKRIESFALEATAVAQGTPSVFGLKIGLHSQAVDPNKDDCGILWHEQDKKEMECLSGATAAQHIEEGTRPDGNYFWPLWYESAYLYFELTVENPAVTPADTGGAVCISRYTVEMKPIEVSY